MLLYLCIAVEKKEKLILIVESAENQSSSLREWVFASSFSPVFVANGVEALLWLGKGNIPDLIIVDAGMGPMNAETFIRTIQSSGFFQEIPVFAVGLPEHHPMLAAMRQAGARDHAFLPLDSAAINQRLTQVWPGFRKEPVG
jgi:CheY-like chemotaxis protein